jgi:hypothetical protein
MSARRSAQNEKRLKGFRKLKPEFSESLKGFHTERANSLKSLRTPLKA